MTIGPEELSPLVELDYSYDPADSPVAGTREKLVDEQMIIEVSGSVAEVYRRLIGELPRRITFGVQEAMVASMSKMQVQFFGEQQDPLIWLKWIISQENSPDVMWPGHLGWHPTERLHKYKTGQGLGRALMEMKGEIGRRLGYSRIAYDAVNSSFWAKIFATDAEMEYEAVYSTLTENRDCEGLSFGPWVSEKSVLGTCFWVRDIQPK